MTNRITFNYDFLPNSRAKAQLKVDEFKWSFEVSNQGNPLKELLDNLCAMITTPSHLWDEQNIFAVDWYCDLIGVRWTLATPDGATISLRLEVFDDIFDEESGNVVFDATCGYVEFYLAIIQELDRFVKKVGLLNYRQRWHNQSFPLTSFLFLKKMLVDKGVWISHHKTSQTFMDEMDLLMS